MGFLLSPEVEIVFYIVRLVLKAALGKGQKDEWSDWPGYRHSVENKRISQGQKKL